MKKFSLLLFLFYSLFSVPLFSQVEELPLEGSRSDNPDWLLAPDSYQAEIYRSADAQELILSNGLIRRVFKLTGNGTTVAFDNLATGESVIRGVKPEAEVKINGITFPVGGLTGQKNYAFLRKEWVDELEIDPSGFQFVGFEVSEPKAPFGWKRVRYHDSLAHWPPKGVHLRLDYILPSQEAYGETDRPLPSKLGRKTLYMSEMTAWDPTWTAYNSTTHPRNSVENEGKIGEIYSLQNTANYIEMEWLPGTELLEASFDTGTDQSQEWGPGISLVFPDQTIKFYLRPSGNRYDLGKPMYGLWDGQKSFRAAGGRQELDLSEPISLRIRFQGDQLFCEAKPQSGEWTLVESIPMPQNQVPSHFRIGKTDEKGGNADFTANPGELTRSRIVGFSCLSAFDEKELAKNKALSGEDVRLSVHYDLYDGIPVLAKWIQLVNHSDDSITVNDFSSELLAAVEYGSVVNKISKNFPNPNIHVETDYAFGAMTAEGANQHAVHWEKDPEYLTQVNYLRNTPALLRVSPDIGPEELLAPGDSLTTFRTFVLPFDSYDRERNGLAVRRMYRTVAPWITENVIMMHARFADWERLKVAIDQSAEIGFEMIILTFGSGFNIENASPEYLAKMKEYADYARQKGVEIGGYSLLASRSIDAENDVQMPPGQRATYGNSPCIGSHWGQEYFDKLYNFYSKTGFSLFEHDGSYPGDVCMATDHPGHNGLLDSQWKQYREISNFYKWSRENGVYLNIPDFYYLTGSNKCGMGYREVNWSLPRNEQLIHARQNIYDGTWTKTPSMGWMFIPLTEYHGGGPAATIEPLDENRDHYNQIMFSTLGAGVQAFYRGPKLYDTDRTKDLVKKNVDWYKKYRQVLDGDILHLRRADGRDIDYWLNINPSGENKGMLLVYNPLKKPVTKKITVPLYYTGLTDQVLVQHEESAAIARQVDRNFELEIEVTIAPESATWYLLRED